MNYLQFSLDISYKLNDENLFQSGHKLYAQLEYASLENRVLSESTLIFKSEILFNVPPSFPVKEITLMPDFFA